MLGVHFAVTAEQEQSLLAAADPDGGECPLSHAVLGGRHLHSDCYVVHVSAAEVRDVAEALHRVDGTWLRERFDAMAEADDFEYTSKVSMI